MTGDEVREIARRHLLAMSKEYVERGSGEETRAEMEDHVTGVCFEIGNFLVAMAEGLEQDDLRVFMAFRSYIGMVEMCGVEILSRMMNENNSKRGEEG